MIPRPLLRSFLLLLRTFSVQSHATLFSEPFLSATRKYYHDEGVTLSATLDSSAYLKRVLQRLHDEAERCESVLGVELKGAVLRVVEDELIRSHVEAIADRGELASETLGDGCRAFLLLARSPSLGLSTHRHGRHVQAR